MNLDRLTARVFDNPNRSSGARLNAYRIDDQYFVDVDLPGAEPAGIDVTVDRQVCTVRVQRRGHDGDRVRQVDLAEALDTDRLEARYEDGVLTLKIPVAG